MLRVMTICFIYLATQNICLAFPKPQSTKLPMPEAFLKYDPKNALNVINLDVYQDSEDPNLYFYVPSFHIQQYKQGAASPFMNSLRIGHYSYSDNTPDTENYTLSLHDALPIGAGAAPDGLNL